MTEAAILHYQQNRAQAQTGKVDRQLLETLRQDAAPKVVAQRSAPPPAPYPSATTPAARSANSALETIRLAGDRLSRWFQQNMPR
jgi:hypothetical protein